MAFEKLKGGFDLTKGVFLAYFILVLHVLLIAGIGIVVVFFRGVVSYMLWIFLAGSAVTILSAFVFYRRMKARGRNLRDILRSSEFSGKSVEISLLGGLASVKIGSQTDLPALEHGVIPPRRQLEDPDAARTRELTELARLFEKELLTLEEFNSAKRRLFGVGDDVN